MISAVLNNPTQANRGLEWATRQRYTPRKLKVAEGQDISAVQGSFASLRMTPQEQKHRQEQEQEQGQLSRTKARLGQGQLPHIKLAKDAS